MVQRIVGAASALVIAVFANVVIGSTESAAAPRHFNGFVNRYSAGPSPRAEHEVYMHVIRNLKATKPGPRLRNRM
jgi:hypothetical protein